MSTIIISTVTVKLRHHTRIKLVRAFRWTFLPKDAVQNFRHVAGLKDSNELTSINTAFTLNNYTAGLTIHLILSLYTTRKTKSSILRKTT